LKVGGNVVAVVDVDQIDNRIQVIYHKGITLCPIIGVSSWFGTIGRDEMKVGHTRIAIRI
jgi:hypothetical protein